MLSFQILNQIVFLFHWLWIMNSEHWIKFDCFNFHVLTFALLMLLEQCSQFIFFFFCPSIFINSFSKADKKYTLEKRRLNLWNFSMHAVKDLTFDIQFKHSIFIFLFSGRYSIHAYRKIISQNGKNIYSYFNKRCRQEALSLRDQTEREYG